MKMMMGGKMGMDMMSEKEMKSMMSKMPKDMGFYGHGGVNLKANKQKRIRRKGKMGGT